MKNLLRLRPLAFLLLLALAACQLPGTQATYGGGDGLSPATAVVVQGVGDERAGIRAEYAWIAQHFPGSKPKAQHLSSFGGKPQDAIVIVTVAGNETTVYFDISAFFGKLGN